MDMKIPGIGKTLQIARKAKGYKQQQLADIIGTNRRTITDLETNKRFPTYDTLYNLVTTLDIDANLFFRPNDDQTHKDYFRIESSMMRLNDEEKRVVIATMRALINAINETHRESE